MCGRMIDRRGGSAPRRTVVAVTALLVSASLASCELLQRVSEGPSGRAGEPVTSAPTPTRTGCSVSRLLVPSCGAWWGVKPGAFTPIPSRVALQEFEDKIGRPVDIYHAYHRGPDLFPTATEIKIASAPGPERLLFLNWKPEMGRTWAEVAAGDPVVDRHIDRLAAYINDHYSKPFFLTIHHEPEEEVIAKPGSGYTASDYAAMFRHVVQRLRARGVDNAVIVMNYMGAPKYGVKPWFDKLYPGDDVVDWISYDPYAEEGTDSFGELVNLQYPWVDGWQGFYRWARRHHPDKPLMWSEWGVSPVSGNPTHKADFFRSMAAHVKEYPRLKAFVYFSAPASPKGDTTIDSSPEALDAYRALSQLLYLDPPGPTYRTHEPTSTRSHPQPSSSASAAGVSASPSPVSAPSPLTPPSATTPAP